MYKKRPSMEQIITIIKNSKIYHEDLEHQIKTDTDFDKYDKIYELGDDFYRFINFKEINEWFKKLYFSKGGKQFLFDKCKVKFNDDDFKLLLKDIEIMNIKNKELKLDLQLFIDRYKTQVKGNKKITIFYECVIDYDNLVEY